MLRARWLQWQLRVTFFCCCRWFLFSLSLLHIYIYIYICIYTCPAESYRLRTEQQAQTIFPKYEFLLLLFMRDQVGGAAGTVDVLSGTSGGGEDGGDGPPDPYKIAKALAEAAKKAKVDAPPVQPCTEKTPEVEVNGDEGRKGDPMPNPFPPQPPIMEPPRSKAPVLLSPEQVRAMEAEIFKPKSGPQPPVCPPPEHLTGATQAAPSDSPPTCPLGFEEVVYEIPADPPAPEIPPVVPVTHRPRRMRCDCLLI